MAESCAFFFDTSYPLPTSWTVARERCWRAERRFLLRAETQAELYVSAVSIWEMRLKFNARHPSGERKSPFDPNHVLATCWRVRT